MASRSSLSWDELDANVMSSGHISFASSSSSSSSSSRAAAVGNGPAAVIQHRRQKVHDMEDLGRQSLPAGPRAELGPTGESSNLDPALCDMVRELAGHGAFDSKKDFSKVLGRIKRMRNNICKNSELSRTYKIMEAQGLVQHHPQLEFFLRTKVGKSASGILSVTVFTSPYPQYIEPKTGRLKTQRFSCKWNCYYCPNHPDHPRSYLPDEPGCLRAERLHFVAADQLTERVETLRRIGHPVDKLEVLVLGGTWESYPEAYREEFIRDLYWAANTFFDAGGSAGRRGARSLSEEQRINETTAVKIIGLTLETRPDTIDMNSIRLLRKYGCTRVQLGVQHLDDGVLSLVNRGHGTAATIRALRLLKDACFKVDIHIMPDLPGTTPQMDREMFDRFLGVNTLCGFCSDRVQTNSDADSGDNSYKVLRTRTVKAAIGADCSILSAPPSSAMRGAMCYYEYDLAGPEVQADQWKIYPCEVTPWTVIEKWFKEGKYVPYGEGDSPILREIIIGAKQRVFPWIRLNRVIRDIPNQHILGGNSNVNLRQMLQQEMRRNGLVCNCIRCREVGLNSWSNQATFGAGLVIRKYNASGGDEYFLSYESPDERLLYGFVRLRLSQTAGAEGTFPVLEGAALVRELHVYGQLIPTYYEGKKNALGGKVQHAGFGSKLMRRAEDIAREKGFTKVAVIAGVGTREYYRRLGYSYVEESGGFLVKNLVPKTWDFVSQFVAVAGVALSLVAILQDSATWNNPLGLFDVD